MFKLKTQLLFPKYNILIIFQTNKTILSFIIYKNLIKHTVRVWYNDPNVMIYNNLIPKLKTDIPVDPDFSVCDRRSVPLWIFPLWNFPFAIFDTAYINDYCMSKPTGHFLIYTMTDGPISDKINHHLISIARIPTCDPGMKLDFYICGYYHVLGHWSDHENICFHFLFIIRFQFSR